MAIEMVHRFTVDDRQLSVLHARAFGGNLAEVEPWSRRLEKHALTWIGAFDARQLIGFVQVCWDGGVHAFLLDTVVDPDRRHRGVGTSLVEAAADAVRAAGCGWLHVDFEPHLATFYLDKCRFRATQAGLIRLRQSVTASQRSGRFEPHLMVVVGVPDDLADNFRSQIGERRARRHRCDLHEPNRVRRLVDADEHAEGLAADHLTRYPLPDSKGRNRHGPRVPRSLNVQAGGPGVLNHSSVTPFISTAIMLCVRSAVQPIRFCRRRALAALASSLFVDFDRLGRWSDYRICRIEGVLAAAAAVWTQVNSGRVRWERERVRLAEAGWARAAG